MRVLTGREVSSLLRDLDPAQARRLLDALSSGLAAYAVQKQEISSPKSIRQPLRTVIQTENNDTTLIMPVSDSNNTVVKVATVPHAGDIQGAITIYSSVGQLEGLLNAAEITAFRTALATMTMLTRWSAPVQSELVVFGAGKQAEWHVRLALLLVPGVQRVTIINRSGKRLDDFRRNTLQSLAQVSPDVRFDTLTPEGNEDYAGQMRGVLDRADIICCCTPSREPLFTALDLRRANSKRFLSLIGSYKPEMQEVDGETLKMASRIYVDSTEACLEEAGELIKAQLTHHDLVEIGDLFSQSAADGASISHQTGLVIFKCVGLALMDLIISKALLEMADELERGILVDSF